MSLTENIKVAENSLIHSLEDFFRSRYDEKSLPSHGLSHHRRVWKYAKELLPMTDEASRYDKPFIQKLLIASFIHDIGMSVEPGPKHGLQSRLMCEEFLNIMNYNVNEFHDLLETIQNHDNKEYQSKTDNNQLLTILSIADDLDAFGNTGIYRYSEIYLLRGTVFSELGVLIRENARKRYENFRLTCSESADLIEKHKKRYMILDDFFRIYNEKCQDYHFGTFNFKGHCGIVDLISLSVSEKIPLKELMKNGKNLNFDVTTRDFINALETDTAGLNP